MTQARVRTSAPWNQAATANTELSVAVDLLLHSIVPVVRVKAVNNPYAAQDRCSILQVEVRLCTPIQISVLTPLLDVMQRADHRAYIAAHLWTPLARTVGGFFGHQDVLQDYTGVAVRFVDGLFDLFVQAEQQRQRTPHPVEVTEKLYVLAHALALSNTTVELELAVPNVVEQLRSTGAAKRSGLRLARALLCNLTAPAPLQVPPATDPGAVDLCVKITRAPTAVLALLNNTFSSNERLPSTSRNSILDLVVTPKIKIGMALKLYSELFIEVYRPFSRQSGVVIAAENGVGGRPRAPACVPVVDLSVDTVAANESLSAATATWVEALRQQEQHAEEDSEVEVKGKALAEQLLRDAEQNTLVGRVKKELEGLEVKVVGVANTHLDVALPFGLSLMEAKDMSRPLFYVHVESM
ncbi:hypothetical protein STCU_05040 [Strigomonas culicis]|nr:hypothetical protein STCU_05040 [Strigomonas culicis]|eukprot:EPY28540.1 hypothetical protein STCU_05040 [Strigomonas culicis]